MKHLKDLDPHDLRWIPEGGFSRDYLLKNADGETIATLDRPRWGGAKAVIDAPGNRWGFERKWGWRGSRVLITATGTGEQVGEYKQNGWNYNGTLTLTNGTQYLFRSQSMWQSRYRWLEADEKPILEYKMGGIMRTLGDLRLASEDVDASHLGLLLFLGWFLMLAMKDDSTASIAAMT